MRVLINDHSGHNFTLGLSRQLAKENHIALHCFSTNFQSPKGYLSKQPSDPNNLFFYPITYKKKFNKYSIVSRSFQELKYGSELNRIIEAEKPDVVICANTPLVAQQKILLFCRKKNIPFIYWCQDLYSVAIKKIAVKKIGFLGRLISIPFEFLEKNQLRKATAIISITEDYKKQFDKWSVKTKILVLPNWSSIEDIKIMPKINDFSIKYRIEKTFNVIYSGTLGFKHNPGMIVDICRELFEYSDIRVIVISEGIGAEYLQKEKDRLSLDNLILIPFQSFEQFSHVLSSADVFFALLEKDAGLYSVPSKILSYLCAGKPIIIAAPFDNLASKIIISSNSGKWLEANDSNGFIKSIIELNQNRSLYSLYSENARNYAELNFKIENISQKFIQLIREII